MGDKLSPRDGRRNCFLRRGFTLVELLVVIGIIGLLLGILIPTLSAAQRSAARIRCSATLRELVAASTIYLGENKAYPDPRLMPAVSSVMPASLQAGLLNDITAALHKTSITPADTIDSFPAPLVCPVRNGRDVMRAADSSLGTPFWQTGYMYVGGLERKPNLGTILIDRRAAGTRGGRRGVIWADTLVAQLAGGVPVGYGFYHVRGKWQFNSATKVSLDRTGFDGQHRGYCDGSVEWEPASRIEMDWANVPNIAAYRIDIGGYYAIYYIF